MTLTTVPQTTLMSLTNIMSDTHSIFVIPTFQRPFAWQKKQIDDLEEDIDNTIKNAISQ